MQLTAIKAKRSEAHGPRWLSSQLKQQGEAC